MNYHWYLKDKPHLQPKILPLNGRVVGDMCNIADPKGYPIIVTILEINHDTKIVIVEWDPFDQ